MDVDADDNDVDVNVVDDEKEESFWFWLMTMRFALWNRWAALLFQSWRSMAIRCEVKDDDDEPFNNGLKLNESLCFFWLLLLPFMGVLMNDDDDDGGALSSKFFSRSLGVIVIIFVSRDFPFLFFSALCELFFVRDTNCPLSRDSD